MPEITVAMPAYNAASSLRESVDSVLSQTFGDFELLVIDDGSTDGTAALAANMGDTRIRVECLPANRGRSVARNMALAKARGRYLAWMDADDVALPHRLAAQHAFLESNHDIHICGASVQYFGRSDALETFPAETDGARAATLFGVPVPNCCVMMRLDAIRACRLRYDPTLERAEDFAFWGDALLGAGLKAASLQQPLLRYRFGGTPSVRRWHIRALLEHIFPALGLVADSAQASLHTSLVYGGCQSGPEAALRWLDKLWGAWVARYGQDAYMKRHILVFLARTLREAAATPQLAKAAKDVLRTLSIAKLV